MDYKITGYKPEKLFHFFEEISAIPRGSANEKAISDYLVAFAKERDLWYHQDALFNVIIKKPASAGSEEKPAVMLQGHTDMVCEKLAGVAHDFAVDPLDLIVKDGVLLQTVQHLAETTEQPWHVCSPFWMMTHWYTLPLNVYLPHRKKLV